MSSMYNIKLTSTPSQDGRISYSEQGERRRGNLNPSQTSAMSKNKLTKSIFIMISESFIVGSSSLEVIHQHCTLYIRKVSLG